MRENRTRSTAIGATVPLRMLPLRIGVGPVAYNGFQPVFVDSDSDGYLDLYVANDTDPNLLLRNLGNGRFKDVSLVYGCQPQC